MEVGLLYELLDKPETNSPWKKDLDPELFPDCLMETKEANLASYLQKETHILSLARAHMRRKRLLFRNDENFLSLFRDEQLRDRRSSTDRRWRSVLKTIHSKMVRPVMEEVAALLKEKGTGAYDEVIERLQTLIGPDRPEFDFQLTRLEAAVMKQKTRRHIAGVRMKSSRDAVTCLVIGGNVSRANKEKNFYWIQNKKEGAKITDSEALAEAVFYHQVDLAFQNRCKSLNQEELLEDAVYRAVWEELMKRIKRCRVINGPVLIDEKAAVDSFLNFLVEHGFQYQISHQADQSKHIDSSRNIFMYHDLAFYAPFQPELPRFWHAYAPVEYDSDLSAYRCRLAIVYTDLFSRLYEEWVQEKEIVRFSAEQKEAAKVFQTKKHIPDKCIKVMEASRFNDVFGYVEIDEECDLELFEEIEKEFLALKTYYFQEQKEHKRIAIRFRKLGRHRAAGIYFPYIGCLCRHTLPLQFRA